MNKKWAWGIGIMIVLVIMIGFDFYKSYTEEKPPFPIVSVGAQEAVVTLGPYKWNSEARNPVGRDEALKEATPTVINPLEDLQINFPEKQPDRFSVELFDWMSITDYPIGEAVGKGYPISNEPGPLVVTINAEWNDGKKATYYISLERDKVLSYQTYFPEDEGTYTFLYVYPENEDIQLWESHAYYNGLPLYLWHGVPGMGLFQTYFPDLPIGAVPTFFVIDRERIVLQTEEVGEVREFFESIFEPTELSFYGRVEAIDRHNKLVTIGGTPFYCDEIDIIQVGQGVGATIMLNNPSEPEKNYSKAIEIQQEAPEFFATEAWKSTTADEYTIVILGTDPFINQLELPTEFAKMKVQVHHLVDVEDPLLWTYAINSFLLFNNEEAVLKTEDLEELIEYMNTHPLH